VGRMQALGCDRCGNPRHVTLVGSVYLIQSVQLNLDQECPSLWRIYTYVPPETRNTVLEKRTAARNLKLGEGGEGYIATDEWCYNCGHSGHLGDVRHPLELPISKSNDRHVGLSRSIRS
jgi:protein AIR1/2